MDLQPSIAVILFRQPLASGDLGEVFRSVLFSANLSGSLFVCCCVLTLFI